MINLRNNPVFQLSLSSKELFHSNFLYWLAMNHVSQFQKVLLAMGATSIASKFNLKDYAVYREKNNFDLSIWEKVKSNPNATEEEPDLFENLDDNYLYEPDARLGKVVFVLENKFKSIPSKTQLDEYVNKVWSLNKCISPCVSCCEFVLLTLATNYQDRSQILAAGIWKEITYGTYANVLKACSFSGFDQCLVDRYIDFIQSFSDKINSDLSGLKNTDDIFLGGSTIFSKYRAIRMHDIWQKVVLSDLALKIQTSSLLNKANKQVYSSSDDSTVFTIPPRSTIFVGIGYGSAGGFLELKYRIDNDIAFIVQVQNGQYRRGVLYQKSPSYKFSGTVNVNSFLPIVPSSILDFFNIGQQGQPTIPFPFRQVPASKFNCYGSKQSAKVLFAYQYVKMNSITFCSLQQAIINDINKIVLLFT